MFIDIGNSTVCFDTLSLFFSHGEDWQPLVLYRNSLVHGEGEMPTVTSNRPYPGRRPGRPRKNAGAGGAGDEDEDDEDADMQE